MTPRILQTLGLCRKAGRLIVGTPLVIEAMRGKKPPALVICASDISSASEDKITGKAHHYSVPVLKIECSAECLAHAVGKQGAVVCVAVTDKGFLKALHLPQSTGKKDIEKYGVETDTNR